MLAAELTLHMGVVFLVVTGAITAYALDRLPLEVTSLAVIATLLVFFHIVPLTDAAGIPQLRAADLLAGFADPALLAILALLVMGQAMVQTGALEEPAQRLVAMGGKAPQTVLIGSLFIVLVISGILNNTPVVVIFIPIMSALAKKLGHTSSRVMIPLSFAAVLGGNLTLIGSSTNLLAAGSLRAETGASLAFFDFTMPGAILAGVGFLYLIFIAPRLLVDRASMAGELIEGTGKQFVVQLEVTPDSPLHEQRAVAGMFPGLPNLTVRMIQRGEQSLIPPYDDITLKTGDILIVAATRAAVTEILGKSKDLLRGLWASGGAAGEDGPEDAPALSSERVLAEVVVAPASRMDGRSLSQIGFRNQTGCIVLGIQRRSRMIRQAVSTTRLEAGDVLLVMGDRQDVMGLRHDKDVLLMEWSAADLPESKYTRRAALIFGAVVASAASGYIPIAVGAITGVVALLLTGCLNVRQATRAVDRRVVLIVGAALAMGTSMSVTGGAEFLAVTLINLLSGSSTLVLISAFFLLVALLTNVLSNNATAVLFTPIAVSLAAQLDMPVMPFVVAVIFAANCSFATPMSYQTNLLVMGPGHYRFADYLRVGAPLILLNWITFTLVAAWYYHL